MLLTLASSSRTGPAERMLGDGEQLRALGCEVQLAVDTVTPGSLRGIAAAHGMSVAPLHLSRHVRPRAVLDDVKKLRAMLAGFDLAHTHFAHDHLLVLWAARPHRAALRVVRAVETEAQFTPSLGRRWAYRHTDGFEVATEERARLLVERFAVAPERVAVLGGAVDPTLFSPAETGRAGRFRAALGLPADAFVIGMVARLKPEREHRVLIAAFASLRGAFPQARLVLVGRGEDEPFLQAEIAREELGDAVCLAGYWQGPDLVEAYRGLDVAVWLREGNDGTSRGVLEAMAVGLPVVAGRQGAMSELIRDGQTGLLVAPSDVNGLVAALTRLLRDGELRRALGVSARAEVLARHGWGQRGRKLAAFYERLRALPPVR